MKASSGVSWLDSLRRAWLSVTDYSKICLAIDTALEACSVAIAALPDHELEAPVILASNSLDIGRGHAEKLMGLLEETLAQASLTYQDLTCLAVTVGPGSFTGLRVGLSTARAFALALDLPLIGLSSLKALQLTARGKGIDSPVASVIDAKRNQIYAQYFAPEGEAIEASACAASDFAAKLATAEKVTLVGTASSILQAELADTHQIHDLDIRYADCGEIAKWALTQPAPADPVSPLYLRAPDAKPQASKAIARV